VRDNRGGIVSRPGSSGRLQAVIRITDAGFAECEWLNRHLVNHGIECF
jgi:hypothetical protein